MTHQVISRGIGSVLVVWQSVIGWPLITLCVLGSGPRLYAVEPMEAGQASAVGQESREAQIADEARIGRQEYPPNVEARKGRDEGLVEVKYEFTAAPSDGELSSARVFTEPLVAVGSEEIAGENAALAEAIKEFVGRTNEEDVRAFDDFLAAYPTSRWRASVQTNVAVLRKQAGYFTEALARLEEAWGASKGAETEAGRVLANRAVGELADLNARFGRYERMGEIFEETDGRDIAGSAQTRLSAAKEGYWMMTQKPKAGFRCGPYAVNAVLDAGKKYVPNPIIAREGSTQRGTNLKQLKDLGGNVGMDLRVARKERGGEWEVPMVVHWKVGHFAAITRKQNGRYLVKDPTFGEELWVSKQALDTEATGYGLVVAKDGQVPEGWAAVTDEEAAEIWGKGGAETKDPKTTAPGSEKTPGKCPPGMATYTIFKMLGTLQVRDKPVGYEPPFGPSMMFEVNFNHLEAGQPGTFNYMNFGPNWECNWVSYLDVQLGGSVEIQLRNGGGEFYEYSGYDALSKKFAPSIYSSAVLTKKSESRYEREVPGGTREVYAQAGGAGRIFLKEIIDPQGNKVVLNYDGNLRLTSVVDALGQSTTISYKSNTVGNVGFYKVYRVTDPFSRYAEFTYDAGTTRLEKIRDVIGIESAFTYAERTTILDDVDGAWINGRFYEISFRKTGMGMTPAKDLKNPWDGKSDAGSPQSRGAPSNEAPR